MALEYREWNKLPYHILVHVFSYLKLGDRNRAARTCRIFEEVFHDGMIWKYFKFYFYTPAQKRYLKSINRHGKCFKWITIELDHAVHSNRENACSVLRQMYDLPQRQLKSVTVLSVFSGETPYFYEGKEFINSMHLLFGPPKKDCVVRSPITTIDLHNVPIKMDDKLMRTISENCKYLETLDIVNNSSLSQVTPAGILLLVEGCKHLSQICIPHSALGIDVLLGLTKKGQKSLKIMDVSCSRNDKAAAKDIPNSVWKLVRKETPNLRVIFRFNYTFPSSDMRELMEPDVPIKSVSIESFSYIYEEVDIIRKHYSGTLEEFRLTTPTARNAPELNKVLIDFVRECKKLTSIHIGCFLYKETVEKINAVRPELKANSMLTY